MIRTGLTELLLFLTPFALYAAFLFATRAGVLDPKSWPPRHVLLLVIVALLLVIGSFLYLAQFSGAPVGTSYAPAHLENGRLVPGAYK
jgi:phosphate/sulfate permease